MDVPYGLTLRTEVRSDDREAVSKLLQATGTFTPVEIEIALVLVTERLAKGDSSGYHFLILEDGNGLAGYCCFGLIPRTAISYDMYFIVVDPERHRMRIGKWLLRQAEATAATLGGIAMYIDTSGQERYLPTRRFYESCEYEIAATLPDFFAEGDPKIIYRRGLSSTLP